MPGTPAFRITELSRTLADAEAAYRVGQPWMSDDNFDTLRAEYRRLTAMYPDAGEQLPPGPGSDRAAEPGSPVGPGEAEHVTLMLSLDKVHAEEGLSRWLESREDELLPTGVPAGLVVALKIDGVAVGLTYRWGRLVRALTRGDGRVGRIIPDPASIPGVATWLPGAPELLEVRGEAWVPRSAAAAASVSSPRAAAVAAIREGCAEAYSAARLRFTAHGIASGLPEMGSLVAALESLRACGMDTVCAAPASPETAADAAASMLEWAPSYDQPTDGVVVTFNSPLAGPVLGCTASAPRWAVALKPAPRSAVAELRDVEWSVGRSGRVTPTAVVAPVELGGSTITRATLHSAAAVERLGLMLGQFVLVRLAGEVIPQLALVPGTVARGVPVTVPADCPSCGAPVHRVGGHAVCTCARYCPEQLIARVVHAASRTALRIGGLGPGVARALVMSGALVDDTRLLDLGPEVLAAVPGLPRRGEPLADAIREARLAPLDRTIVALGIPGVGRAAATQLAASCVDAGTDLLALLDMPELDLTAHRRDVIRGWAASRRSAAIRTALRSQLFRDVERAAGAVPGSQRHLPAVSQSVEATRRRVPNG